MRSLTSLLTLRRRRRQLVLACSLILLMIMLIGCLIGPVTIPVETIFVVVGQSVGLFSNVEVTDNHDTILLRVRFPRVVQGALVGMGLGVSGSALQGLFQNPMADPYVLGLSSGAALGAAIAIVTGLSLSVFGLGTTPIFAFIAALGTMFLVYTIARTRHGVPVISLLLAGVAVGTVLAALVTLLMVLAREKLEHIVFWLMGGLGASRWPTILTTAPYLLIGSAILIIKSRELNLLATGEQSAHALGLDIERSKRIVLALASLVTASAVCASGTIAFVGLIVPHIARLIVGPDYRFVVPASALIGAALLVSADILARIVMAPSELPVGVVTSLLGGPFFLWLLRKRHHAAYGGD